MNIDELIVGFNDINKSVVDKIKAAFRTIPVFIKYLIKIYNNKKYFCILKILIFI